MNILIVEDAKYRIDWFNEKFYKHDVTVSSTGADAKRILVSPLKFDILFLDHDLGGKTWVDPKEEDSGSEIVRFMIEHNVKIDLIVIHSHNEPCSLTMQSNLMEAGYMVSRTSFKNLAHTAFKNKFAKII